MSSVPDASSPTATPRRAWQGRLAGLRADAVGGLSAALVLLAINGGYGLVALSALGPSYSALGFVLGVQAAALSAIVTTLIGDRGPLLGGPAAALSLLVPPVLLGLLADPQLRLADGRPDVGTMLALVAAGVIAAGLMQVVLAWLKLGRIARYVPYPVQAGYMNSVAILIVLAMLPHLLGLPAGTRAGQWQQVQPLAPVVALVALLLAWRIGAASRRLPAFVLALLGAAAVHHGLQAMLGGQWLGPTLGTLQFDWPRLDVVSALAGERGLELLQRHAPLLLAFATAIVITGTIQTLMAGNVIDSHTGVRRDGESTLQAYGWSNALGGVMGMPPMAGAVSASMVALRSGATSAAVRPVYAMGLVLLMAFGARWLAYLPMAAIGGVFVLVASTLVDAWTRRSTASIARALLHGHRPPAALLAAYATMAAVVACAVGVSLLAGVALGVLVAVAMFIRSHMRAPVRSISTLARRRSHQVRTASSTALLDRHGQRVAVIELDGALFFGTADAVAREIERQAPSCDAVVLDLRRVSEIDASGARELLMAARQLHDGGKRLLLGGLPPGDARTRALREMDLAGSLADADLHPDIDRALEAAENHVLAAHGTAPTGTLDLAHTLLAEGLDAAELALLSPYLTHQRFARGSTIFGQGDAGDALYVALSGRVGIWLPEGQPGDAAAPRRLVSYVPGVPFGEIGLLRGTPRSASARAEDDVVLLVLSRAALERLAAEHPRLHARLLLSLCRHVAARLATVTVELQEALRV